MAAILAALADGEPARSRVIARRVLEAHPGEWTVEQVQVRICFAYDQGLLERLGWGLYRLPTGTVST